MKKHLLVAAIIFGCLPLARATVFTVQVANFQFSPSTVNAVVGDTIMWTWVNGSHTTTCDPATQSGNSLPAGAATWNSPMNTTNQTFSYKLTVAGTYNYWCIPHAAFGMVGVINVTSVLPVVLLSFTASVTKDNKALLTWVVTNEQNTDHYTIQKSIDGKTFTDVGSIAASSNSSFQKTYSFTDNTSVGSRYIYYALKTVDKDGRTQLSPIALYKNESEKQGMIISISPNPVSGGGHLMFQFSADKAGTMLVQLFDANGKLITEANMMAVTGINNGHFHLGGVQAGTYIVVFSMDNKKETRRLLIE